MADALRVAVHGAAGRMGLRIIHELQSTSNMVLAAAWEAPNHPELGSDAGKFAGVGPLGVAFSEIDPEADVDAIIDFSLPDGMNRLLEIGPKKPLIGGTTGIGEREWKKLEEWTREVPAIWSANYSLGINILRSIVEFSASRLPENFVAELFDLHHGRKLDAPSGTARLLGQAVAKGREKVFDDVAKLSREGTKSPRHQEEIGFAALRGGDVTGEHTVFFLGEGERLELTHRATDRGIFVRGAIPLPSLADGQTTGTVRHRRRAFSGWKRIDRKSLETMGGTVFDLRAMTVRFQVLTRPSIL